MSWVRNGFWKSRRAAITPTSAVGAAAQLTVEALETRRLFAFASYASVPLEDPSAHTLAAQDNFVLIGEPSHSTVDGSNIGQVIVADDSGNVINTIANPEPSEDDSFGAEVTFLGNGGLAVSSNEADGQGMVYIYDSLTASTPSVTIAGPYATTTTMPTFGYEMKGFGSNQLLVASADQGSSDSPGKIHIYNTSTGALEGELTSGAPASDSFGTEIAVQGDTIFATYQVGGGKFGVMQIDGNGDRFSYVSPTGSDGFLGFGTAIDTSADSVIISGGDGQNVYAFNTSTHTLEQTYTANGGAGAGVSLDVDSNKLIVGDVAGTAYVFDVNTGEQLDTINSDHDGQTSYEFANVVGALSGNRFVTFDYTLSDTGDASYHLDFFAPAVSNTNHAPVAEAATYAAVNENSTITLNGGGSTDEDNDTLTYAWDLDNDGQYDDAFTQTVSFTQDLPGTYTVGLQVSDGTDSSTDTAVLTFNDVAPTANAGPDKSGIRGQSVSFTGSGASTTDAITGYAWDFNYDGTTFDTEATGANTSHTFDAADTYTVALKVTDDDGQSTIDTATVTITAAGIVNGDLVVGGTSGTDIITIGSGAGGSTTVTTGGTTTTYSPTGRIIVYGGDSADLIIVSSSVTRSTEIHGGAGNDVIQGGGGSDVIIGDAGVDVLSGGDGRDILIGGADSDVIAAGDGEDILVAGTTSYDNNSTALSAIQAEWNSSRNYNQRVANIRNGSGTATRLNGSYFLSADTTVFDDGSVDVMLGGNGKDLFYYNNDQGLRDLTDQAKNETFYDVDVMPA